MLTGPSQRDPAAAFVLTAHEATAEAESNDRESPHVVIALATCQLMDLGLSLPSQQAGISIPHILLRTTQNSHGLASKKIKDCYTPLQPTTSPATFHKDTPGHPIPDVPGWTCPRPDVHKDKWIANKEFKSLRARDVLP